MQRRALTRLPNLTAQAFTLVLAICLSVGSPKPSAVFSVRIPHSALTYIDPNASLSHGDQRFLANMWHTALLHATFLTLGISVPVTQHPHPTPAWKPLPPKHAP